MYIALQFCICYNAGRQNENTLSNTDDNEKAKPPTTDQSIRVVFAMYGYLANVKTNVSNANRNNPKVIKSLKQNYDYLDFS